MDELVGKLATKAGIDSVVAEKTVGISVDFLRREDTSENVRTQIAVGTRLMASALASAKFRAARTNLSGSARTKSERLR
jgi:hypothetical protein